MNGTVQTVSSKQVNTQNGPATAFSLNINGDWYSAGFKQPACVEGDLVDFEFKLNGQYKNLIPNTLRVTGKGEAPVQGAVAGGFKKKGSEFRTPDQIMRTTSLEQAISSMVEVPVVEELILLADAYFDYIKNGGTPVNTNQIGMDEDIPFN